MTTLSALFRYPVKSLQGSACDHTLVEKRGLQGDRRWMIVDGNGVFLTARNHPVFHQVRVKDTADGIELSHDVYGTAFVPTPKKSANYTTVKVWRDNVRASPSEAGEARAMLSRLTGVKANLVFQHSAGSRPIDPQYSYKGDFTSFSDGFPILLTSVTSIQDVALKAQASVAMQQFRPNIVVDGFPPWDEDCWRRIRIGGAIFRIAKPCSRCVVTTLDAETGKRHDSNEPLKTLSGFRRSAGGKIIFGQNLIPEILGTIQVGDPVEVLEMGPTNIDW